MAFSAASIIQTTAKKEVPVSRDFHNYLFISKRAFSQSVFRTLEVILFMRATSALLRVSVFSDRLPLSERFLRAISAQAKRGGP